MLGILWGVGSVPKIAKELSDLQVRRLKWGTDENGRPIKKMHPVGGVAGLLLQCSPPPKEQEPYFPRSWILRVKVGNSRPDLGLGSYPEVSLSIARDKARELKQKIRDGENPVLEKQAKKSALLKEQAKLVTFESLAKEFINKKDKEFKTRTQTKKLASRLETYVYPHLAKMIVGDIERAHIVAMLEPIWTTKTETADRVRSYTEAILSLAAVKGLRSGDNPARWKGNLDMSLPQRHKVSKVQHFKALPVEDMPVFMEQLTQDTTASGKALQFIIYTAARSGEVRNATWEQINLEERIWTVPADLMKMGKPHRVPLCDPAIKLLQSLSQDSKYLFPNRSGKPLSDVSISKIPKKFGHDITAHGFRSTFKDWCRKHTNYHDEVSELALAHVNDDATRSAYARDELIDKRRLLMADWAQYCLEGKQPAKVLELKKA